jgi:hypothetical protein
MISADHDKEREILLDMEVKLRSSFQCTYLNVNVRPIPCDGKINYVIKDKNRREK